MVKKKLHGTSVLVYSLSFQNDFTVFFRQILFIETLPNLIPISDCYLKP